MHLPDVIGVRRIDQGADSGHYVPRAYVLPRKRVGAGVLVDAVGVLLLVDDLHRHEAHARFG
jgi:hypothetical protein